MADESTLCDPYNRRGQRATAVTCAAHLRVVICASSAIDLTLRRPMVRAASLAGFASRVKAAWELFIRRREQCCSEVENTRVAHHPAVHQHGHAMHAARTRQHAALAGHDGAVEGCI